MILLKVNTVKSVVCFGTFFLLTFFARAQKPQLNTTVNKRSIVIGEPLQYRVEATLPANTYKIGWLNIPDSTAHFEVVEKQKIDTVESNGVLKVQQFITLTSFDSGTRIIPSFAVSFDPLTDDTTFHLFTDSIRVNVAFSPMDSTKTFHDIKTIIGVKDERPFWVWIVAGLLLVLLVSTAWYFFKKRPSRKSPGLFSSKLSPLEEALQSLDNLQKQQLLTKPDLKQFHSALGEIFKRYISRKTTSNLLNLTSGEVLLKLNELHISNDNIGLVAGNLRMADAVKFAKYLPGNIESETAFANTKKVIGQIDQSILNTKSDI